MPISHDKLSARLADIVGSEPALAFLRELGGVPSSEEWFLVGGAVRDAAMGRSGRKDFDFLVRGVSLETLSERLSALGEVNLVGARFGVLKFRPRGTEQEIDIAWPRTEHAGGSGGFRDFAVQADPALPVEKDLERRDFTMNAVAWDVRRGKFIDPFGGLVDIELRIVRAVGNPAVRLAEDFSRMLRGIRFSCELAFEIEDATWQALKRLASRINDTFSEGAHAGERVVPYETIAREIVKALRVNPAKAVGLLEDSGLLFQLIPELIPLSSCAQPADHHSEGDVWNHTRLALANLRSAEMSRLFPGEWPDATTAVATLFHDIAKPQTAAVGAKGQTVFYGHAEQGAEVAVRIAERLKLASAGVDTERLEWLVKMHLVPNMLRVDEVKRTTLEKHFLRDREAGRQLLQLACADASASVREDGGSSLGNLEELLKVLAVLDKRSGGAGAAKSLLSGEEVMMLTGVGSGPQIGQLLEALREAQLSGRVSSADSAKEFLLAAHLKV